MAGIYLHIPFCKQACNYCSFHFSTSVRRKNELIHALLSEIEMRRDYLDNEAIETIYFGGGTPSLLTLEDITSLIEKIRTSYRILEGAEITLEANPDDIRSDVLREWTAVGINRLSLGIQSFFDEDLKWMNRAHTAVQAIESLAMAIKFFDNITMDLIYGFPLLTNEKWEHNVKTAIGLAIPHLSCYALTVEPRTLLHKLINQGKRPKMEIDQQSDQFLFLMKWLEEAGYQHYEISNFAKPGFTSKHNSSYWSGTKYLGIGPSAHSFDGMSRQWNVSNNQQYINSINEGQLPCEKEYLTPTQQLNETIMTSLRTIEGLSLRSLDKSIADELRAASRKYVEAGCIAEEANHLKLTTKGKLFADRIAGDLFFSEKKVEEGVIS